MWAKMSLRDVCEVVMRRIDGRVESYGRYEDIITNAGLAEVAKLIGADLGGVKFGYIAIGSGTTAPAATDTALEFETHRASATVTHTTTTVTGDTAQFEYTFSFTASYAISESGVFNDPTAGVMLCRQTFPVINVVSGDALTVTWKIVVS